MYHEGDVLINTLTNESGVVLQIDKLCKPYNYLIQYSDGTTEWLSEIDLKK